MLDVIFQYLAPTQGGRSTTARCRAGGPPEKLACTGRSPKFDVSFPTHSAPGPHLWAVAEITWWLLPPCAKGSGSCPKAPCPESLQPQLQRAAAALQARSRFTSAARTTLRPGLQSAHLDLASGQGCLMPVVRPLRDRLRTPAHAVNGTVFKYC